MRLLSLTAAFLAPLSIQALVQFTNSAYSGITAGQAFKLTWQGDGTPVTITLMNGPSANLATVSTVASTSDFPITSFAGMDYNKHQASAISSSYDWTPPEDIASGTYALSISQLGFVNYSPQFTLTSTHPPSTPQSSSPPFPFSAPPPASSVPATATAAAAAAVAKTTTTPSPKPPISPMKFQPPYPAGPGNGSYITTTGGKVVGPKATGGKPVVPSPSMTIYHGNGTLVGGAGRREGRLVVVGAVVLGGVLLGMGV